MLDVLYTVHFALGTGFWHKVYRRATCIELAQVGVPFVFLRELPLTYAGQVIAMRPTRLMLVDRKVLLATVALDRITATHTEKLRWAQQVTGCQLAILANFAPTQLDVRFCGSSRGNIQGQRIQDRNRFCTGWRSGSGVGI